MVRFTRDSLNSLQFNPYPLISPALTQESFASPANGTAFAPSAGSHAFGSNQSPIEALQEQQRHFQEQLTLLQHQQRQIQATAAVVAASTSGSNTSPYGPSRAEMTPGGGGHSGGTTSISTPSPGYFSPLTSPALEASSRHYSAFTPGYPNNGRAAHPLSALSSPALNPIGSSGGAQQTLSPALQPQNESEMADPEYIRALVGLLDSQNAHQGFPTQSDKMPQPQQATGPHRTAPQKSRPSPLVKATSRKSHSRHGSLNTLGMPQSGTFSLPSSPISTKFPHMGPPIPFLPPATIDQRGAAAAAAAQAALSTVSTPSPVDLSAMMPPPPLPSSLKSLIPMTPASLMNLDKLPDESPKKGVKSSARIARRGTAGSIGQQVVSGKKGQTPIKITGNGKRMLAIRPSASFSMRHGGFRLKSVCSSSNTGS